MKIVIFDLLCAQPVGKMKFHGGGEYTKAVFKQLISEIGKTSDIQVQVCYNEYEYMDEWIKKIIADKHIIIHNVKSCHEIFNIVVKISSEQNVCFFSGIASGYPKSEMPFPQNVRTIGVFHGMRLQEKPYDKYASKYGTIKRRLHEFIDWRILESSSYRRGYLWQKDSLINFDIIITVSKHSEYSIRVNYQNELKGKQIIGLYSPMKEGTLVLETNINEKYIMMISADRWLKNSYRGVMAIDSLYDSGFLDGVRTKIYGNLPNGIIKEIKNKNMFDFYGYVSGDELEQAYANCDVFFYPTLNEGFGYPPLEAMKYSKTCVISAVCSLTEIYGSSVYYCNPYDIMEMKNRLLQAIDNNIPPEIIMARYLNIRERQNNDLHKLCGLIIYGNL